MLFGWTGLYFEGVIQKTLLANTYFFGLLMKDIRMDEIVEKLFDKKIYEICWMTNVLASKCIQLR